MLAQKLPRQCLLYVLVLSTLRLVTMMFQHCQGLDPEPLRPHSWALLRLLSSHFYSAVVEEEDTLLGWSPLALALKGHTP